MQIRKYDCGYKTCQKVGNKESDIILPEYNFEFPFQVIIPSREEWILNKYDQQSASNFFTDGSKTLDGTGFGIHGEFEVEKSLNNTATVFQAEAKAISYCAELLCTRDTKNKTINIYIY